MICSPLQITASCFDFENSCVSTCENETDVGCRNAGMYGYVRECRIPRISSPQINEGWSNSITKQSTCPKLVIIILLILIILSIYFYTRYRK